MVTAMVCTSAGAGISPSPGRGIDLSGSVAPHAPRVRGRRPCVMKPAAAAKPKTAGNQGRKPAEREPAKRKPPLARFPRCDGFTVARKPGIRLVMASLLRDRMQGAYGQGSPGTQSPKPSPYRRPHSTADMRPMLDGAVRHTLESK